MYIFQKFKSAHVLGFLLVLAVVSSSCDRNRNHPGWDYFPDMFYSTAYETYTPNPNFKDGKTFREPVKGTVSREMTTFAYTTAEGERERAGKELVNTIPSSKEVLERGKRIYTIYCLQCHGADGNGTGKLYTSGVYPLKPRSLVNDVAKNLKDGEIYHSITLGFVSMGPHGAQIKPDDRWKLIHFIREDLQKNFKETSDTLQLR